MLNITSANVTLLPQGSNNNYAVAIVLLATAILTYGWYGASTINQPYPGFPLIGKEDVKTTKEAKQKWLKSAKSLIYDTLAKTGRPFQVLASTGPLIILPANFMAEVRNDDRMTFGGFLKSAFFTSYPGMQGFRPAVDNSVFVTSVRIGLTQALAQVTQVLSIETVATLEELYPLNDDWKSTHFSVDGLRMIGRLSSRIFLPEPLCHDPDWLRISVEYTVDFFAAAFALRLVPVPLRPIVHWFLPQTRKARRDVEIATRLIEPELERRRKNYAQAEKEGREIKKPVDALTWMDTAAQEKGYPTYNLVWGQLNYSLGAIHTTANTFVMVLYDLVERPKYIKLLREEIEAHWDGGELTKATLYNLKLMDSFMKESQRLSPVTLLPINRVADEAVTLKDGTKIPKNACLGIPVTAMTDEKFFKNALEFDGHRFYNMRMQPGNESKYQFVTTSDEHISFGHGKHACPGRFFASNEIKILLVHLLSKYDFKFVEGEGKPKPMEVGVSIVPNPKSSIMYRRRATS